MCPCSVLLNATPKGLATFCTQGEAQEKLVDDLFNNGDLMRDMLRAGGAKSGRYGNAMQIYTSLNTNTNDGILDRLAPGTSLELAVAMNEFDTKIPVNPIERYHQYKQAHLQGELDPSFQGLLAEGDSVVQGHGLDGLFFAPLAFPRGGFGSRDMPPLVTGLRMDGSFVCLGAAWKYSFWEDREGLDFVLEAQAREQTTEWTGVCRLEWAADALGEVSIGGQLNPDSFWRSLALIQKHRLAHATACRNSSQSACSSVLDKMEGLECAPGQMECRLIKFDGKIVIPAMACTTPTKGSKTAMFIGSVLGERQLHIRDDQTVKYNLSEVIGGYHLVIRLVTVHLKTQPLLLTITNEGDGSDNDNDNLVAVASIVVPYTVGMWALTEPVEIVLGERNEHPNINEGNSQFWSKHQGVDSNFL